MSSPSPRRPLMAANWKMHKTPAATREFIAQILPLLAANFAAARPCEVVIAPPFPCLPAAAEAAQGTPISLAGQNLHWEVSGAFTGEVSAEMLLATGCQYVIIGHSERRQYFGETDETVNRKLRAALTAGLKPIVCVGETLEQREAGRTEAVLRRQFEDGLRGLTAEQLENCVLAYEPVWAIGTGRTATPEIAAAAHHFLRELAGARFGAPAAARLRILYGGSVKPDLIRGLMAQPEIDGGLVGGASLDPQSFAALVNF